MHRRRLLAQIGFGSLTALGGCLGGDATPADSRAGTESPTDTSTETDESTPGETAVEDQPCPPYQIERDSAVCSHTVDPNSASVYLDASPETAAAVDGAPDETVTLTLHNQSSSDLTFNPHSWSIWYNSGTGWEALRRQLVGDGKLTVSAGEAHSWSFTEAVESVRDDPELEPGLYAAELGVPDPENSGEWIACLALVRLDDSVAG